MKGVARVHSLHSTSKAFNVQGSTWAFAQPTAPVQEVAVKDGEEGLAALVARDVEVTAKRWHEHAEWYKQAAVQAASEGSLEPKPRR